MTDPAKVHASAIVIDTHADTPQRFVDEHWNFTDPLNGGMLNYDSARKEISAHSSSPSGSIPANTPPTPLPAAHSSSSTEP